MTRRRDLARALAVSAFALVATAGARPARSEGVSIDAASSDRKAQAQDLFTRALEKSKAGQHADAAKWFRASHEIVASPNALLMLARSLVAMDSLAEAHEVYEETIALSRKLASTKKYEATEKSANTELAEIATKLGFVRLELGERTGEVSVAGRVVRDASKRAAVRPGSVEVVFRPSAGSAETKRIDVALGGESLISFAAAPAPLVASVDEESASSGMHPFDMGDGQRITSYVLLGVGAVGMGLFAGLGAANDATFADLEKTCQGGCPPSAQDDIDSGRALQTGANVSVVVGAIGLAAGAALLIPTFFADPEPSTPSSGSARLRGVTLGLGTIGLRGSFE